MQLFNIDGDMYLERFTIIDDNNVISPNHIHSESMRRTVLNLRPSSYDFGAFKLDLKGFGLFVKAMKVKTTVKKTSKFCTDIKKSDCWIAMIETEGNLETKKLFIYPGAKIMLRDEQVFNSIYEGKLGVSATCKTGQIQFRIDKQ